jgi:hypothetical protein
MGKKVRLWQSAPVQLDAIRPVVAQVASSQEGRASPGNGWLRAGWGVG